MPKRRKNQNTSIPLLSPDAVHDIEFFKRRKTDDPRESIPALAAMAAFPKIVRSRILAVLKSVAEAPPTRFAGGGMWEAMHGEMSGFFEIRVRHQAMLYRVFCLLDTQAEGVPRPILAVIDAAAKKSKTTLSRSRYGQVRDLGDEYRKPIAHNGMNRRLRSVATESDIAQYLRSRRSD